MFNYFKCIKNILLTSSSFLYNLSLPKTLILFRGLQNKWC